MTNDPPTTANVQGPSVGFLLLVVLVALNFFRIGCQLVVTAWSAVQITGRTESAGQILLITSMANLALSPFIGALIDRCVRKKPLVMVGHAGILLCGVAPHFIDLLLPKLAPFSVLALVALVASVSSIVIGGGMDYFTKLTIASDDRIKKLATISSVSQLALIAGTAFGGYIVSCVSWRSAFLPITGCSFLLVALCAFRLPPLTLAAVNQPDRRRGVFLAGPALYLKHHHLFSIACCSALAFAIGQATNTLLPPLMSLHLGLTGRSYSLVEAAWSIGALAASVGLAKIPKVRVGDLRNDLVLIVIVTGLLSIVPRLPWLPALLAAHLLLGAAFSLVRIRSETRFLTECPTHLLGRFRANSLFITSFVGVVIFMTPTVCDHFSIPALYQLLSAMVGMSATALLAFGWRQRNSSVRTGG
ncbi:MFS transporter [Trinickia symbiotica]|uniref:MFS transporter n=1 Tax=Trinickia symbiotica TaxID=863227 RepID=A0A2N7X038_9BURK|nr:MFS transporter [Trinickia symbiotica]PMS35118.1 MFS transporter [Trinickia symbiotica]PPK43641.1 MFS transporter [Trinickia symbiotica]